MLNETPSYSSVELSSSTKTNQLEQTPPPSTTSSKKHKRNITQNIGEQAWNALTKAYQFEMGTFNADKVPEVAKDYLNGETGFEMEPDQRFEDYDYLGKLKTMPSKTTTNQNGCFYKNSQHKNQFQFHFPVVLNLILFFSSIYQHKNTPKIDPKPSFLFFLLFKLLFPTYVLYPNILNIYIIRKSSATGSLPPAYSKSTAHKWACLMCYPCCCFKCCCKQFCERKCQNKKNIALLNTNSCYCLPSIKNKFFKRFNFSCGSICCLTPTTWDFMFESNRSRVLALWNLVMCMLLLFSTLNPIGSLYEKSPGCQNAFGYRPGLMKAAQWLSYTNNISDVAAYPQKYCNPMNLIVSLSGTENKERTTDYSMGTRETLMKFSGSGHCKCFDILFSIIIIGCFLYSNLLFFFFFLFLSFFLLQQGVLVVHYFQLILVITMIV